MIRRRPVRSADHIQAWLELMQAGQEEQAWWQLTADNPMPAIHGRQGGRARPA